MVLICKEKKRKKKLNRSVIQELNAPFINFKSMHFFFLNLITLYISLINYHFKNNIRTLINIKTHVVPLNSKLSFEKYRIYIFIYRCVIACVPKVRSTLTVDCYVATSLCTCCRTTGTRMVYTYTYYFIFSRYFFSLY